MSIINDDSTIMEKFAEDRQQLPTMRERARELEEQIAKLHQTDKNCVNFEIKQRGCVNNDTYLTKLAKLDRELAELRERIRRTETGEDEAMYLLRMGRYVAEIASTSVSNKDKDASSSLLLNFTTIRAGDAAGARYNDWKHIVIDGEPGDIVTDMDTLVYCQRVKDKAAGAEESEPDELCLGELIDAQETCEMVCVKCGAAYNYIPTDRRAIAFGEVFYPKRISSSTYHEFSRVVEWISQSQARESVDILDHIHTQVCNIVDVVRGEAVKQKLELTKLDRTAVRRILRKLEKSRHYPKGTMSKMYEHATQIAFRISGVPSLRFTPEQEERLRSQSLRVICVWNRWQEDDDPIIYDDRGKRRQNMISFAFLLRKLCELNEFDNFIEMFPLLKAIDKRQYHNRVWKKMCETLHWQYIPSEEI